MRRETVTCLSRFSLLPAIWTLFLFATSAAAADSNNRPKDVTAAQAAASNAYGKLPLSFEANQGQTDKQVKFLSRGPGYALFLTPTETVLSLKNSRSQPARRDSLLPVSREQKGTASRTTVPRAAVLRIRLDHANSNPEVSGIDELAGKSNYFIGKDPANGSAIFRHLAG
jgi:hypothetical protein